MGLRKNILFRVDAGEEIGLGHFYRSLNLALALKELGHRIIFTFKHSSFWTERINSGFEFENIQLSLDEDIDNEETIIRDFNIDVFYVDGFIDFSGKTIATIKAMGVTVVFYQNLNPSRKYSDIYILPSIHQKESFFEGFSSATTIFAGLKYFTFSKNIVSLPKKKLPSAVKNIAVIAGGSDPRNTLKKIYDLAKEARLTDNKQFTFYYGINYLHKENISAAGESNCSWQLFNHEAILENDLLISAFGVSTYEFLALGMPVIAYGHQEQNANSANYLADTTKALISLGLIDNLNAGNLSQNISVLERDPEKLLQMTKNANAIIDLEGIKRVRDIIHNI